MKDDRLTIKEAAAILGVQTMTVSLWLRQGDCPFGTAIRRGPKQWTYLVWKKEVMDYAKSKGIKIYAEQ